VKPQFDDPAFTAHSIGFVTADEQARLCQSCVFVCGVGGISGAAFMDLLRACVVRPDPQPESRNDPTSRQSGDAITAKDRRAAVRRVSSS
jgi:hypothetical protein